MTFSVNDALSRAHFDTVCFTFYFLENLGSFSNWNTRSLNLFAGTPMIRKITDNVTLIDGEIRHGIIQGGSPSQARRVGGGGQAHPPQLPSTPSESGKTGGWGRPDSPPTNPNTLSIDPRHQRVKFDAHLSRPGSDTNSVDGCRMGSKSDAEYHQQS